MRTGAHATRVMLTARPRRRVWSTSAEARWRRRTPTAEVVLSGGAVNSPQLLDAVRHRPGGRTFERSASMSASTSPGSGRTCTTTPRARCCGTPATPPTCEEHLGLGALLRWRARGNGPLTSNIAEGGAFFTSRDELAAPDLQAHIAPSGFYDNGLHERHVADVHRGPHAGRRQEPRPAAAALDRPDAGTPRSTRRTTRTGQTSTPC
ncbi:MAG: hypothetical protein WKF83_15985 [Nocardioidaceae bacterium]